MSTPSLKENALDAWLDSQDFYELCRTYRHAEQGGWFTVALSASQAYENLKEGIRMAAMREGTSKTVANDFQRSTTKEY